MEEERLFQREDIAQVAADLQDPSGQEEGIVEVVVPEDIPEVGEALPEGTLVVDKGHHVPRVVSWPYSEGEVGLRAQHLLERDPNCFGLGPAVASVPDRAVTREQVDHLAHLAVE